MPESISPYALLCACRPKPAPAIVTAYDLYSQAQQRREQLSPAETPALAPAAQAEAPAEPSPPRPLSSVPVRRTHYIADIQSRHSAALRRAPMQNHPLT